MSAILDCVACYVTSGVTQINIISSRMRECLLWSVDLRLISSELKPWHWIIDVPLIYYLCVLNSYYPVRIYGIRSVRSTLHSKHSLILEEIIFTINTDSIKGQVRYIQTLTVQVQVEAPSLETSKFFLYFWGGCIPINPKLSYIFTPEFLIVFSLFQCKKYQIFDEKF